MSGAFVFEDVKTKEQFRVIVKPYKLAGDPDRRVEFNLETKTAVIVP
jgi:hypothetical protein